jgi:membrane fusion protein (multidrug efflux system)
MEFFMQGVFIKQKSRKSKKGFCPFCPPGLLRKPVYLIIYTIAGSFLLLSTLILAGCGNDQASVSKGGRPGDTDAADASNLSAAIPVQVTPVRRDDISLSLMQTTTIEAIRQVDILAKVPGQVIQLPVEEGMQVKQDHLLAKLNEDELKIEYLKTKVSLETDKAAFERAKNMLEKNLIAEENFETIRLQYESSKAAHEAALIQLEYTNIRAPFSGVVTARYIEIGQRVSANQSLFVLADFNPLRAKIYVPEKEIGRIYEGQQAKIHVEAEPGSEFSGTVKMISPVVDPSSGTSKVTIDIVDNIGKLKPGMFASVFIDTETHENSLIIPKKALILESDLDQVYIYQEGIARKVTLQIGFTSGDDLEILSGLQEGDLVVTAGQDGLREGLPIRIPEREETLSHADSGSWR